MFSLVLTLAFASATAFGSIGSSLGFTSRATALGGAMVASGFDSASAYQNPASLSSREFNNTPRLQVHWSLLFLSPEFTPINGVVVENPFTSDQLRSDSVDTQYPDTFGQSLGLSYQFKNTPLNWSFGFVSFLPLDNLALIDSGETYIPEYVLHRSQNQRPVFDFAIGIRPTPTWSLGAGIHLGTALSADTTIFLQNDTSKVSTMRIVAGLKTRAAPFFGTEVRVMPGWNVGLVARLPLKQPESIKANAAARALSGIAALDFNFNATSVMFYDPLTVELGSAIRLSPAHRVLLQLDYQAWSRFESPAIEIQTPSTTQCDTCTGTVLFAGSNPPVYSFRDIIVPRAGFEWRPADQWTFRAGYSYRPSIYEEPPSEAGNLLDPSEHRFAAGVGKSFSSFLDFDTPCRLDFHVSYHQLVTETIAKSPGDERGAGGGNTKIGAPGYEAGGYLWGGGVSLAVML